ncbi:hypothetical protein Tco_1348152 [Tanacetum coccineum]
MSTYLKNMSGYKRTQLKNKSFEEIQMLFEKEMKRVNIFVDMDAELVKNSETIKSEVDKAVPELAARSTRKYWKIIRVRNHTKVHHFIDDMLKAFNRDDLVMLWSLVKEKFNSTEPIDDKEREIWVELKRLFEPDTNDEVHHVSIEKGIDIYMLVEKEYPLSRGTLTLMLVAKLLVDQDKEMSRELLRKIFMQKKLTRRKIYLFQEKMESVSAQVVAAAKLPVLNPGEFEL